MSNFAIVDKNKHSDINISTERSAAFGDNIMHSMTFALESVSYTHLTLPTILRV